MLDELSDVAAFCRRMGELYPDESFEEVPVELIEMMDAAVERYPTSAHLHCLLGDILQTSSHKLSDAVDCYDEAIRIDPLCAEAYEGKAILLDITRGNDVIELLETALAIEPRLDSFIYLARQHAAGERISAAREELLSCQDWLEECLDRVRKELEQLVT